MSRKLSCEAFSFRTVFNFYDEIYPFRGKDDLWIDTVHNMMQCQFSIIMVSWALGNGGKHDSTILQGLLGIGAQPRASRVLLYSDASDSRKIVRDSRRKYINKFSVLNDILEWSFEMYILPHPKIYMKPNKNGIMLWNEITKEYSEVIKRNGGKPDKETYTRKPLFPIEIMEWGREDICWPGGKRNKTREERKRFERIRKLRATHR